MVAAHGQHGGCGQVGRGGDGLHLGGGGERLVPSSAVDAGLLQRGQGGAAAAADAGSAQPVEDFSQEPDRELGFIQVGLI